MDAGTSIGGDAVETIRNALLSTAALPKDVVEAVLKGYDHKG